MTDNTDLFITKQLDEALSYHKNDDLEEAITIYDAVLDHNPNQVQALHAKAIALAQQEDYKQARSLFENALSVHPDHPIILGNLANCHRRMGDVSSAKRCFLQSLAIQPTIAAHLNLAILYYDHDEIEPAISAFSNALALNPLSSEARFNLALCYLKKEMKAKAKGELERVIAHDPYHISALLQLGKLYLDEQALLRARTCYEKVLLHDPQQPQAHHNIGIISLQEGDDAEGLASLEKAKSLDATINNIHHNLACVYLHKRQYKLALENWLQHVQYEPHDTHYNIGVCYLYMGRYQEAQDHFNFMLKRHPNHHATLVNLGACALQQNHKDRAIAYYEQAQSLKPQDELAYILAALRNESAQQAPIGYVTDLFNQYAHNYDNHLNNVLSYQVPNALSQLIRQSINPEDQSLRCLDLGCGTGLCGESIHRMCYHLSGIDAAQNMLDLAKKKNLYHDLTLGNIPAILHDFSAYDLVVAGDVFPYLGDIASTAQALSKVVKKLGYLVFSTEKTSDVDYKLQDNARFSHSFEYINRILTGCGFALISYENTHLRTQQKDFVEGLCYVYRFNR